MHNTLYLRIVLPGILSGVPAVHDSEIRVDLLQPSTLLIPIDVGRFVHIENALPPLLELDDARLEPRDPGL
jgi:hypothetical protein